MRLIVIGFGVVGESFAKILLQRQAELVKNYGIHPKIVAVADKFGVNINPRGLNVERLIQLKKEKGTIAESEGSKISTLDLIESTEAEVVFEVTPTDIKTGEPGLSHIKTALRTGKHVVTTNKGPLALALPALTELAEFNKVYLRFSGTVGGGTPILDMAKKCLMGDRIVAIRGILNGTTNYILTEMAERDITFQQALENAQKLGYAEADPSMDIDGIDAACKLVIMANWIMNKKVTLKDVKIQGIRDIDPETLKAAAKQEHVIKLIGSINNGLKVMPTEIPKKDPLCVSGVLNAVTFTSEFAGEETIIGRGAGGMETASAMLRDLIDIKQSLALQLKL